MATGSGEWLSGKSKGSLTLMVHSPILGNVEYMIEKREPKAPYHKGLNLSPFFLLHAQEYGLKPEKEAEG